MKNLSDLMGHFAVYVFKEKNKHTSFQIMAVPPTCQQQYVNKYRIFSSGYI